MRKRMTKLIMKCKIRFKSCIVWFVDYLIASRKFSLCIYPPDNTLVMFTIINLFTEVKYTALTTRKGSPCMSEHFSSLNNVVYLQSFVVNFYF